MLLCKAAAATCCLNWALWATIVSLNLCSQIQKFVVSFISILKTTMATFSLEVAGDIQYWHQDYQFFPHKCLIMEHVDKDASSFMWICQFKATAEAASLTFLSGSWWSSFRSRWRPSTLRYRSHRKLPRGTGAPIDMRRTDTIFI